MVNYGTTLHPGGLPGATAATRYVGGTASGAPVSGTFQAGDFVIAQNGIMWICTVAGSPGTWKGTIAVAVNAENTLQVFGSSAFLAGLLDIDVAGSGLQVAEGANAKQGTAVANGTTAVAVPNTSVTANSRIFLGCATPGGTPGALYVSSVTPGTGFSFKSTNAADTSTIAYEIFEPG
jgi:hypothetical protein